MNFFFYNYFIPSGLERMIGRVELFLPAVRRSQYEFCKPEGLIGWQIDNRYGDENPEGVEEYSPKESFGQKPT